MLVAGGLMRAITLGFLCIMALHAPVDAASVTVVRMPRPESALDERTQFAATVLAAALQRSGRSYRVELHPVRMQQGRALLRLQNGHGIDVVCTATSREREAQFQPIRIPLDKGLLGWRLLLVERKRAVELSAVRTLADLKRMRAGQGIDWPDTDILRANGLAVHATSSYSSLFSMLARGRIDYFPRGVTEVWKEQQHYRSTLAVADGVVLRYPAALYFFVRKGSTRIERDITLGLESMLSDGSFEQMFEKGYGAAIRKSGLRQRRVIELDNPVAPATLPLQRRELWFRD